VYAGASGEAGGPRGSNVERGGGDGDGRGGPPDCLAPGGTRGGDGGDDDGGPDDEIEYKFPEDATFVAPPVTDTSATSKAMVDARGRYVLKVVHNKGYARTRGHVLRREVCVLKRLREFDWAPRLVWWNSTSMITTYVGRPMDAFNIPLDYRGELASRVVSIRSIARCMVRKKSMRLEVLAAADWAPLIRMWFGGPTEVSAMPCTLAGE